MGRAVICTIETWQLAGCDYNPVLPEHTWEQYCLEKAWSQAFRLESAVRLPLLQITSLRYNDAMQLSLSQAIGPITL
jgi:hypothetical protein